MGLGVNITIWVCSVNDSHARLGGFSCQQIIALKGCLATTIYLKLSLTAQRVVFACSNEIVLRSVSEKGADYVSLQHKTLTFLDIIRVGASLSKCVYVIKFPSGATSHFKITSSSLNDWSAIHILKSLETHLI